MRCGVEICTFISELYKTKTCLLYVIIRSKTSLFKCPSLCKTYEASPDGQELSVTLNIPTLVGFGGRLPVLCTDHRQAHLALLVNVGVIDLCLECDLGRFEGVFGGENNFDPECAFVVRRVILKASEGG